jgi:SH3-like domain-containing protein
MRNHMSTVVLTTARFIDQNLALLQRRIKVKHVATCAMLLGAGISIWMLESVVMSQSGPADVGETTASIAAAPEQLGPSGFPIPRFLTLKANKVNVRKGPSSTHAVAWVFQRKGMPVEVTAEFENWRKIRDSEGAEGWILQQMLTGRRFATAAEWSKDKSVILHESESERSAAVVRLAAGALAQVKSCSGEWCYLTTDDYEGYARQSDLWGVYPGEAVD